MLNESLIWQDSPYNTMPRWELPCCTGCMAIFGIIFIELGSSSAMGIGLEIFGVILLIVNLLPLSFYIFKKVSFQRKNILYQITNLRATVTANGNVVQQCQLSDCTVSVMNRYYHSYINPTGRLSATNVELGDVMFFKDGVLEVAFSRVPDPDDVMMTASQFIPEQ